MRHKEMQFTMTGSLRTLDDIDVEGRRVLLRADLNVPMAHGSAFTATTVVDDARIRAVLPTIEELRRRGARLVLAGHLGHPDGPDPTLSMRPVADRLARITGAPVALAPSVIGPHVRELTECLLPGEMLMLENVRFEPGEIRNDPTLVSELVELADLYVDDAFACSHHEHASVAGAADHLPSAAGRLMEREVLALRAIVERPARPLVAVVGGVGPGEKINAVRRLLDVADCVCVGGAVSNAFLAALGHPVGATRCATDAVEAARGAIADDAGLGRLALPRDLVLAKWGTHLADDARAIDGVDTPDGWIALDIGPRTAERYTAAVRAATTAFWTGPVGCSELNGFAAGTRAIASAIATSAATTIVSGTDTIQALRSYGLDDRVNHLSSGGTATLEFLAGHDLPGVTALERAPLAAG